MKKTRHNAPRAGVVCGALCLALALCACGRKTAPEPDLSALSFYLRNVFVEKAEGGCLVVRGSIGGATRNVASAVLELQPLEGSCEDCPFVSQERTRVEGENIWEAPGAETFSLRYCPASRAEEYRWRLSVQNALPGLPPQISPVGVTTTQAQTSPSSLSDVLARPEPLELPTLPDSSDVLDGSRP